MKAVHIDGTARTFIEVAWSGLVDIQWYATGSEKGQ